MYSEQEKGADQHYTTMICTEWLISQLVIGVIKLFGVNFKPTINSRMNIK